MTVKKLLAVLAVILFSTTMASAQLSKANLTSGPHGQMDGTAAVNDCTDCHKPHNATNGVTLLWEPALPTTTYNIYGGGTMAKPTSGSDTAIHSYMCMSCHDGNFTDNDATLIGTGTPFDIIAGGTTHLTDDHPVNRTYPTGNALFNDVSTVLASNNAHVFGASGSEKVECGSCHDPHDNANTKYLRATGTTLCVTCHK